MRTARAALGCALLVSAAVFAAQAVATVESIAFASFAPLNTDIFLAAHDGSDATPLLPHPALDYNASFSSDGRFVVFTSERSGSADIYRARVDGTGLERVVDHPAFDDQAALSPDGHRLAFVSSRSGQADIWILDIATDVLRNLTNSPSGEFRPAWSPDGQWLAFSSDRDSQAPRQAFTTLQATEIFIVRPDGTGLRKVTQRGAFVGSASWTPDGTHLVLYEAGMKEVASIIAARRLRGTTQIAVIDVATGARRVLTAGTGEKWSPRALTGGKVAYVSGGPEGGLEFVEGTPGARGDFRAPAWSGGERLVFHREVGSGWPPHRPAHSADARYRLTRTGVFASYSPDARLLVLNDGTAGISHNGILRMNADGSERAVLLRDSVKSALAPSWSPRGDRIAFAFGRFFPAVLGSSSAAIAIMQADGSGVTLLTGSEDNAGFPSWAPDGRQLVYRVTNAGRSGLRIVNVGTRVVRTLTEPGDDNSPAWSPRGDRIAFTAKRGAADYDIFTVRVDGTDVRRLTTVAGNDSHPAWSPDGEWIVFTTARHGFKDEAPLHPFNPQPYGEIAVMRPDGSDVRVLTDNQFEDGTPVWIARRDR